MNGRSKSFAKKNKNTRYSEARALQDLSASSSEKGDFPRLEGSGVRAFEFATCSLVCAKKGGSSWVRQQQQRPRTGWHSGAWQGTVGWLHWFGASLVWRMVVGEKIGARF